MPRQYGQVLDIQDYNPYVFQGTTIAPKLGDVSFLAQSIKDREQRQANATIQQANLNKALGEARDKLNVEERQWFDAKQAELMQGVNDEIAAGNYSNAMNIAIAKAGELANDDELQQKIKANKDYTEYSDYLLKEQQAGRLSTLDYEYLKAANNYEFKLGEDWKPVSPSVTSFDEDTFWALTKQSLAEYRYDNESNKVNYDESLGMSYTKGGRKQVQSKTPEALKAFAKVRLMESEELKAQAEQRYNAYMYKAAQLDEQIKKLRASNINGVNDSEIAKLETQKDSYYIKNENGVRITNPVDYIIEKQMKSEFPNHIGYSYVTTSSNDKEQPKGSKNNTFGTSISGTGEFSNEYGKGTNVVIGGNLDVDAAKKEDADNSVRNQISGFTDEKGNATFGVYGVNFIGTKR